MNKPQAKKMFIVTVPNDDDRSQVTSMQELSDPMTTVFTSEMPPNAGFDVMDGGISSVMITTTTSSMSSPAYAGDAYAEWGTQPLYSYETDPDILKAQMDLLSNPYSSAYSDAAYSAIMNVQDQCRADYVSTCTNSGDFIIALNDFFNEFSDPAFVLNRRRLEQDSHRHRPSFFHDKVVNPMKHMYHALAGKPPHNPGERRPEEMGLRPEDMRPGAEDMRGRPGLDRPMGKGMEDRHPHPNGEMMRDGPQRPFFSRGVGGAAPHKGAHLGPPPMKSMLDNAPGPMLWAAQNDGHPPISQNAAPTATTASAVPQTTVSSVETATATTADIPAATVAAARGLRQQSLRGWHAGNSDGAEESNDSAEESDASGDSADHNGRDHGHQNDWNHGHENDWNSGNSDSSSADQAPPIRAVGGRPMPLPTPIDINDPAVSSLSVEPAPPVSADNNGNFADGDAGFFDIWVNEDGSDSSSSSSSSSSSDSSGYHKRHHGHRHVEPEVYTTYQGALGYGAAGDSCVYANLDNFSPECQEAVMNVYSLRYDYEDSSHPHGCHGMFWVFFVAFFIVALILGRKRRLRRQKVVALLKALEANPALKTTVEAETGVVVVRACLFIVFLS